MNRPAQKTMFWIYQIIKFKVAIFPRRMSLFVGRLLGALFYHLDKKHRKVALKNLAVAFGDSSVDFVLRFWISDPTNGLTNIKGAAFLALWDTFKAHDIGIPYPHREILLQEPVRIETATTGKGRGPRAR